MSLYPRLFENPNAIYSNSLEQKLEYDQYDTIPFSYYDDKMYTGSFNDIHGEFHLKGYKGDPRGKYSGRLWPSFHLITFWHFPENKEKLKKVLNDLQTVINNDKYDVYRGLTVDFKNEKWKIEVPSNKNEFEKAQRYPDKNADVNYPQWGSWEPKKGDNEFIDIKDYKEDYKRSKEELTIQHLDMKNKHNVPYGYGSKNPKYHSKRQWQMASVTDEGKEENHYPKLFENPEKITGENGENISYFTDSDSYAFGFFKGKLLIRKFGTHLGLAVDNEINIKHSSRNAMKYTGRLWKNKKLISFWQYPPVKQFKTIIDKISESIGENMWASEWKVEVVIDSEDKILNPTDISWRAVPKSADEWNRDIHTKLIPIPEYTGSKPRSKEEITMQHLDTSKKHEVPYGYGSKNPKYQTKRQWQMAAVTDEGKEEELYPKLFENPNAINIKKIPGVKFTGVTDKDVIIEWDDDIDDIITFSYDKDKTELYTGFKRTLHNDFPVYRGPCSGRIFKKYRLITFWQFPENRKELFGLLEKIEKKAKIKIINDEIPWRVEIPVEEKYKNEIKRMSGWGNWNPRPDGAIYPTIFEYTKPFTRSKEELAIKHLIPPAAGKKEVPYGYGSKNPKYHSKRQWQMASVTDEGKEEELYPKLFETPDTAINPNENGNKFLHYTTRGSFSFGYYNDKLYVSQECGWHSDIKHESKTVDGEPFRFDRYTLKYAGRIWVNQKLISFWEFPENKEELRKIIDDLENYFKENDYIILNFTDDDWYIEIGVDDDEKNVKLSDYVSSKPRSKEELAIQHLDMKHKHEVPYGYGSKNPKYMPKRQWQMASVTDESMFYPKLFKLNEMTESGIRDFIGTKPTSSIRIEDEGDNDVILAVDRKTKDDIITTDYIDSITKVRTKQYLMDYLKEVNPEITTENVDSYKIPFGDFWQHQVEVFNTTEEKKKTVNNNSSEQSYIIEKTSVNTILDYLPENKKEIFKKFVENIPNSLIVNPINALFELLSKVISDEEEIAKARVGDEVYNLSRKQQNQWKDDMIKYLGSMHDISELSQGDFYRSQVLNKDTFVRALFDIHSTGIGKGEIMICYLFNGSSSAGGDVDYDIVFYNGKNYEVKEYLDSGNTSIRLGKGGKTLQFDAFNEVVDSVKTAAKLFTHHKEELEKNINPMFYRLWSYMATKNIQRGSYDKAIFAAISTGELSNANLNRIIIWHYFAKDLVTRGNNNLSHEIIKQLEGLYYVEKPESIKDDFDKAPQQYFNDNEGLDAFIIFRPDRINIAKADDLVYATISQAGFKFIEKTQEKRQPSVADTAYKSWKEQINNIITQTTDAEDNTSLKSVLNNISFADFYEKESIEKHLQKVTAAEDAEFNKKLEIWQKRYDAIMGNPKRSKKENDKWMQDNPKPIKL